MTQDRLMLETFKCSMEVAPIKRSKLKLNLKFENLKIFVTFW